MIRELRIQTLVSLLVVWNNQGALDQRVLELQPELRDWIARSEYLDRNDKRFKVLLKEFDAEFVLATVSDRDRMNMVRPLLTNRKSDALDVIRLRCGTRP